jgi:hypothetical protein
MQLIRHTIFEYEPTQSGLSTSDRDAMRDMYRELLSRAKHITTHKSGWVCMIEWANIEDADFADWLTGCYFLQRTGVPSDY